MALLRKVVNIFQFDDPEKKAGQTSVPPALACPLRPDLVKAIHTNVSKNRRQAYAVTPKAGYDTAAESWGTGRAVARIPRVPGGGTHRAGQGAFGNMCRGGGMFCPTKTWRRWHRKVNQKQKRYAVVSALAASSVVPLVMARGHRIGSVSELPLVVSKGAESMQKTKQAVEMLKKLGCEEEMQRVINSKKVRKTKGKMRNRRYVMRRGPLVIYKEDNGIVRAMRNIPGVQTASVTNLNLLNLAPGGQFGRFVIWTEGAFKDLKRVYGLTNLGTPNKSGFHLPIAMMENADIARIINSEEVQSVLRPKLEAPRKHSIKRNALKNKAVMSKLNPGSEQRRLLRKRSSEPGTAERKIIDERKKARVAASKEYGKTLKKGENSFFNKLMKAYEAKPVEEEKADEEEE